MIVSKAGDPIASALLLESMASTTSTGSNIQFVKSDQSTSSFGKRRDTVRSGGVLKRLGASLMQPFMVLRERFSHLLRNAGGSTAEANGADEPTVQPGSRPVVAPPCFYALPGAENRRYGLCMDNMVNSLDAAASVLGQEQTLGQRLLKGLDSFRKWFCCSAPADESLTPEQQKYKDLFDGCRKNKADQRNTNPPEGASHVGLTALYLHLFGRELTAEAVQGLVAEGKNGRAAVHELAAKLKATKDVATGYRSLPFTEVLKVFIEGKYFLDKGDALAVFLDGIVAFAGEIAEQRKNVQKFISQDDHFASSVQTLLRTLTANQQDALKLRLNDFLAAKAYRIFDFARTQSSLSGWDSVSQQLSSLSLGEQVMDPLREQLQLLPRSQGAVIVSELDAEELAAVSRVLVHIQISKN